MEGRERGWRREGGGGGKAGRIREKSEGESESQRRE